MSAKGSDVQQRDKLLLRLLKTPPQPRPKRERIRWSTEAEVEACEVVSEMEKIDGKWVIVGRRRGRLFRSS